MPREDDAIIGHNHDGTFNEDYCKWCYADGTYTYKDGLNPELVLYKKDKMPVY